VTMCTRAVVRCYELVWVAICGVEPHPVIHCISEVLLKPNSHLGDRFGGTCGAWEPEWVGGTSVHKWQKSDVLCVRVK